MAKTIYMIDEQQAHSRSFKTGILGLALGLLTTSLYQQIKSSHQSQQIAPATVADPEIQRVCHQWHYTAQDVRARLQEVSTLFTTPILPESNTCAPLVMGLPIYIAPNPNCTTSPSACTVTMESGDIEQEAYRIFIRIAVTCQVVRSISTAREPLTILDYEDVTSTQADMNVLQRKINAVDHLCGVHRSSQQEISLSYHN